MIYTSDEKALIWLNNISGLSVRKKHELLNFFDSPSELFTSFRNFKNDIVAIVGEIYFNRLVEESDVTLIEKQIEELNRKEVKVVTLISSNYPNCLNNIDEPPLALYCRGDEGLLDTKTFAIVGARRITKYGREVTKKFTKELSYQGFTIISGLARGVDSVAHEETLAVDGKTIAVLGCGVDIAYPAENRDLAIEIANKGLILSEYPLGAKPLPQNFPQRNRIISGLACGVLITEAGQKSGSMITANIALEQGKDIFAVPGSIFSEESLGTNEMIKKRESVIMVTNINDIFEVYNLKSKNCEVSNLQLDFIEQSIMNELKSGDMHIEEIILKTSIEAGKLMSILTSLEICGLIKKLPGNNYSIINN